MAAATFPAKAAAQLDLGKLQRQQLPNGLTLLTLEEHTFPSVSVQMLYRIGARNEPAGQSGIAHFLEHMAFRATENFPDTDVVSTIYAAGGEWHGYTWIDQTTYFSTVPSDQLDLLLRIEADRMQRLLVEPRWLEPEKGAVLAEMHGYENDPAAVLHDAVVYAAFQGHPYRNNVIGWESDILALQHRDVVNFYRQHYVPANAVLAVVGDFDQAMLSARVRELFGDFPATPPTPLPHTTEPPQQGERRVELLGAGASHYFEIAYPAPAASDPGFAALLVLQQWLSGGTGVNFMQEYGSSPVQPGSALHGRFDSLNTWFPPAAQDYLFSFQGTLEPHAGPERVEQAEQVIESVLQRVRKGALTENDIAASRQKVLEELVYDLASHEHTAHQLAYYAGLDALDEWLALPQRVAAVGVADLQRLANLHMQPWQRTIGWYRAGDPPAVAGISASGELAGKGDVGAAGPVESGPAEPRQTTPGIDAGAGSLPEARSLLAERGLPLLIQQNPATPSSHVSLVFAGTHWRGSSYLQADQPVWGYSSLSAASLPGNSAATVQLLLREIARLEAASAGESDDPYTRMQALMEEMLQLGQSPDIKPAIALVVISGQVPDDQVQAIRAQLDDRIPPATAAQAAAQAAARAPQADYRLEWPRQLAQAQLAYVVPAPLPASADYPAWRALQYILAHDYEGRLGKEAISNRGLAYYIDSQYRSDGRRAWVGLGVGVDPAKLAPLAALFREQVAGLRRQPPSTEEVAEARNHLLGRLATARQTNSELAAGLAEHWLWFGQLPDAEQQRKALAALDRQQVLDAIPGFLQGKFVIIDTGKPTVNVTD